MKKVLSVLVSVMMIGGIFTSCSNSNNSNSSNNTNSSNNSKATTSSVKTFDTSKEITVISREDGSGTRGAFTELFEVIKKDADGNKVDMTVETADITQSTGVMLTNVSDNKNAIGYISLGSLNDTVKVVKIDGAEATIDNIKSGTYKISRPFNIATGEKISEEAQDFINFIMSAEGQKIVEEKGYISQGNNGAFAGTNPKGKVTIAGSSSVSPVMEKLKEAYEKVNADVTIEINQSDSTNGMNSVIDGICDIGMASRELKESELSKGLKNMVIAMDGIAVIVNNENSINDLTKEQVKEIYMGNVKTWAEINK